MCSLIEFLLLRRGKRGEGRRCRRGGRLSSLATKKETRSFGTRNPTCAIAVSATITRMRTAHGFFHGEREAGGGEGRNALEEEGGGGVLKVNEFVA